MYLCTWHLLCGICCVAVCCVAVCCVDTHIKAEASATHIIYVKVHVLVPTQQTPQTSCNFGINHTSKLRRGVCCPLCLWCLLRGYPHNLCHNCHKACVVSFVSVVSVVPAAGAGGPQPNWRAPYVGRRPSAAPQGNRPDATQDERRRDERRQMIMHNQERTCCRRFVCRRF